VRNLGTSSIECTKSVYSALLKLQFLSEVDHAWKLKWRDSVKILPSDLQIEELQAQWQEREFLMKDNFELFEPIIAMRGVLLKILEKNQFLPSQLMVLTKLARMARSFQIASNAIYKVFFFFSFFSRFFR
jgi:hypothetical protein